MTQNDPILMGILNVTPDSFSDGGNFLDPARAIEQGLKLIAEGADILDIGGESTRPGAEALSAEEETRRILPVIEGLRGKGALISVDTRNQGVACRILKPLLADPKLAPSIISVATELADKQAEARNGHGAAIDAAQVLAKLKAAVAGPKRAKPAGPVFKGPTETAGMTLKKRGAKITLEFSEKLSETALRAAFEDFMAHRKERSAG